MTSLKLMAIKILFCILVLDLLTKRGALAVQLNPQNVRVNEPPDTSFKLSIPEQYSNGNEAFILPVTLTDDQAADIQGSMVIPVGEIQGPMVIPVGDIQGAMVIPVGDPDTKPMLDTTDPAQQIPSMIKTKHFGHKSRKSKHSTPKSFCKNPATRSMQTCGIENKVTAINMRIVGGTESIRGRWPWMVSLYHTMARQHMCGATLIDSQWLITARHCFDFPFNVPAHWIVRVGEHNRTYTEPNEQSYRIRRIIAHRRYGVESFDYDIALVKLDRPVRGTDTPICLPTSKEKHGELCMALGWGTTEGTGSRQVLREVEMPVIHSSKCRRYDGYRDQLTGRMMCAGYPEGGRDTCHGDSGGPLQCQRDGRWTIVGVASWGGGEGDDCGEPNEPAVFTRIHSLGKWVKMICP